MAKMVCKKHGKLTRTETKYGGLWVCKSGDCDVKCWEGPTSFPGTQEDFNERRLTHAMFDPQWKNSNGCFQKPDKSRGKSRRRGAAYKWLAETLCVHQKFAHIGMLDAEQCRFVRAELKKLMERHDGTQAEGSAS